MTNQTNKQVFLYGNRAVNNQERHSFEVVYLF
jgi:hypothetical protein